MRVLVGATFSVSAIPEGLVVITRFVDPNMVHHKVPQVACWDGRIYRGDLRKPAPLRSMPLTYTQANAYPKLRVTRIPNKTAWYQFATFICKSTDCPVRHKRMHSIRLYVQHTKGKFGPTLLAKFWRLPNNATSTKGRAPHLVLRTLAVIPPRRGQARPTSWERVLDDEP